MYNVHCLTSSAMLLKYTSTVKGAVQSTVQRMLTGKAKGYVRLGGNLIRNGLERKVKPFLIYFVPYCMFGTKKLYLVNSPLLLF